MIALASSFCGWGTVEICQPRGKFNGDVVGSLEGKLKINRLHAVGVIEQVLFRSTEEANRQQGAAPGSGDPARHLQGVFRHQWRSRNSSNRAGW